MGQTDFDLFAEEEEVITIAQQYLASQPTDVDKLVSHYENLITAYRGMLKNVRKLTNISDNQGRILQRREKEIKSLLDNSDQGFFQFGADLHIDRDFSQICCEFFGQHVYGKNVAVLLSAGDSSIQTLYEDALRMIFTHDSIGAQLASLASLPKMIELNGRDILMEYKIIAKEQQAGDTETIIMAIATDTTEKRKAEEKINFLSYHDNLTGLYNRTYLDKIVLELESFVNLPVSIIIADMNCLKLANDVFGHQAGDKMLRKVADIFKQVFRQTDVIVRWGGDEFLILLPRTESAVCENICQRIKEKCRTIPADPIELSVALGYATKEIPSVTITEIQKQADSRMYADKLNESQAVRKQIVSGILDKLHSHCASGIEHNERVKGLALKLLEALGYGNNVSMVRLISLLANLHDIGKIIVPAQILCKVQTLTDSEWTLIKSHSEAGYRIAQLVNENLLAESILAMHERWDGHGYPNGLRETQIPLGARIVALVHAYDVMINEKPYRRAMSHESAVQEIIRCAGSQFDAAITEVFLKQL